MFTLGVTLFEPFGGIASGAEMLLSLGVPIIKYVYSDISTASQAIAAHRLQQLTDKYGPDMFPLEHGKMLLR